MPSAFGAVVALSLLVVVVIGVAILTRRVPAGFGPNADAFPGRASDFWHMKAWRASRGLRISEV